MPDDIKFVKCIECGNEQADMGNNVACENCGEGPMPTESRPIEKAGTNYVKEIYNPPRKATKPRRKTARGDRRGK